MSRDQQISSVIGGFLSLPISAIRRNAKKGLKFIIRYKRISVTLGTGIAGRNCSSETERKWNTGKGKKLSINTVHLTTWHLTTVTLFEGGHGNVTRKEEETASPVHLYYSTLDSSLPRVFNFKFRPFIHWSTHLSVLHFSQVILRHDIQTFESGVLFMD